MQDERLGRGVGGHVREGLVRGGAGDVDDGAAASRDVAGDTAAVSSWSATTLSSTSSASRFGVEVGEAARGVPKPALLTSNHGPLVRSIVATGARPARVARSAVCTLTLAGCRWRSSLASACRRSVRRATSVTS